MEQSIMTQYDPTKEQLLVYQQLNLDLSKKVQELKILVSVLDKELTHTRGVLMNEQMKSSELRRSISLINGQCTQFFNGYNRNLKACLERTDLNLTVIGEQPAPEQPVLGGLGAIAFKPPSKIQGNVSFDPNRDNLLLTICEESQILEVSDDSLLPVTSTPLTVSNRMARERKNLSSFNIQESASCNFKTPVRVRRSASLINESIPEEPEVLEAVQQMNESIPEVPEAVEERVEIEKQSDINTKVCWINLNTIEVGPEVLKNYNEVFGNGSSTADLVNSTSDPPPKRYKRRPSSLAPRRSTGRPKRASRSKVGSLKEKSLGRKLRRS